MKKKYLTYHLQDGYINDWLAVGPALPRGQAS